MVVTLKNITFWDVATRSLIDVSGENAVPFFKAE
jgi:hypothetical protein